MMETAAQIVSTTSVFPPGQRPAEPAGLRWSLRLLKVPGLHRIAQRLALRGLPHCRDVVLAPGFKCLYGNVHATQVALNDVFLQDYAPITIGRGSAFSFQCIVLTATHDLDDDFRTILAKPVVIGRNVWITTRVTILGGSVIGDGSVIGAGSVVTGIIPPGVFAAGVPAKPIRAVNNPEQDRYQ